MLSYLLCLVAGLLVANALPHLAAGTRGESFPTPFAKPRGRGPSSPLVNALWGSANLALGVFIANRELPEVQHGLKLATIGFVAGAVFTAWHFGRVRDS